ncbi:MAG: DUF393 domain-containing protein [Bdellovibrionales bacterium]|nr:DUF393 domain-containing protein [Bdellovibrionales bacterium]
MKKIIFFDGVCNLCNQFVDFVLKADKKKQIHIAPLQGETAKKSLTKEELSNLSTVIYLKDKKTYKKSRAVLEIASDLGWPYKLLKIFIIIPTPLRDIIYSFISKYRYVIFGKRQTCRLPNEAEKQQFLD